MGFFEKLFRMGMGHHGGSGGGHHGRGYTPYDQPPGSPPPPSAAGGVGCPRCGTANTPDARFCRQCGAGLTPAACTVCGAALNAADRFCAQCGRERPAPPLPSRP